MTNDQLETLLKVRKADRQQRRLELAEAYRAEELLQQQAEQMRQEMETMRKTARVAASPGQVNVDELVDAHRYELLLRTQSQLLEQRARQVREETERRRQLLVEADRQVRLLEKLQDRQRREQQSTQFAHELKEMDEIAQRTSLRRKR